MLDIIRKRKSSFISFFIILAVVAVMALYGIGGGGSGGSGAPGGVIAWVNGEPISAQDFNQELEMKVAQFQRMFGDQYDEKFLYELQIHQRTLDELIQFKLLAQQGKRLNILVPDEELADYIRSIPYYQKDGKFDAKLYASLPNRGIQEKKQRERMLWTKMQSYLANRIHITPLAAKTSYLMRETKIDLQYAKINFEELAAKESPAPKHIKEFIKNTPEKKLFNYYNAHATDFQDKAAVNLNQIRVGIPYKASDKKKAAAKKKIDEVAAKVNAGNFAEIAKKYSDDEYAKKGGKVGWITRGTLEKPLEAAINKLGPGIVSAPVETPFGYFILQVTDRRSNTVIPFEKVKDKIGTIMATEQHRKNYIKGQQNHWDRLLSEGKSVEKELKKSKIALKKTGPFSVGQDYIPNIGQSETLMDAVFGLSEKNPVAKKLYYHQNHYYYLKLSSVVHPNEEEFPKNQEMIEKSMTTSLQTALLSQWITSLRKNSTIKKEVKFPGPPETIVQ